MSWLLLPVLFSFLFICRAKSNLFDFAIRMKPTKAEGIEAQVSKKGEQKTQDGNDRKLFSGEFTLDAQVNVCGIRKPGNEGH